MTGTYDALGGLLLMPYGSNVDAWGVATNSNLTLIMQGMKGITTISSAGGSVTLSNVDFAVNQTRQQVFKSVSVQTSDLSLIIPPHQSWGAFVNSGTSGGFTCSMGVTGGIFVSLPYGAVTRWYTDGTNTFSMENTLDKVPTPVAFVNMGGYTLSNLPTPTLGSHAATKTYVDTISSASMDTISPPTVAFSFNGQRLTNLGSPLNANDAVNLQSMNGAIIAASLSGVSTITADANTFIGGPVSGALTGTPAFRAINRLDLPATTLSGAYVTASGTITLGLTHGVNTTAAPITLTVPAATFSNANWALFDAAGTFNSNAVTVTTADNAPIMGLQQPMTFNTQWAGTRFWWTTSSFGWRLGP